MTETKLLNLFTNQLEAFEIGSMPTYIAISHVWSEALFPPSLRGSLRHADGIQMIATLLRYPTEGEAYRYCWIDTWCIDQDDTEDKLRQIPLMSEIYRNALFVLITVRHPFSFSQADWNAAIAGCQAMIDVQRLPGDEYQASPARIDSMTVPAVRAFFRAYEMMTEIATLPWGARIWTAQEFILARSETWIGSDLRPLRIDPADCRTLYQIRQARRASLHLFTESLGIVSHIEDAVERAIDAFDNLSNVKMNKAYSIKAMLLAAARKCSAQVDEIYGLMAASGVVIEPVEDESPVNAWSRWWALSIRSGNLYYALLPKARNVSGNCVMPPFGLRCELGSKTLSHKTDSWGRVAESDGTIDVYGKVAGEIRVRKFLCENDIPDEAEAVAKICGESVETAAAFMRAIDIGQTTRARAAAQARNVHVVFRILHQNSSTNSTAKRDLSSLSAAERQQLTEMINEFEAPPWVFGVFGRVYLASLNNSLTVSPVLVITDEHLNLTETLIGLDLTKRRPTRERHVTKQLMVVRPSPDGTSPMHKVGMTYPVFLHEDPEVDIKDCVCTGHVLEDNLGKFRIGGSDCSYCVRAMSCERRL